MNQTRRRKARRPRRTGVVEFGAPMGRSVKFVTGACLSLLVIVIGVPQLISSNEPGPLWIRISIPALVILILGIVGLFSVRGFEVKGRELWVRRPLWWTRVPLQDLQAAHVDEKAMKRAWRTAGNGGLFAFTGWFRSKRLGSFRAFVTDPELCVVMEFKDRKLVVSPDDPERFVGALGYSGDSRKDGH